MGGGTVLKGNLHDFRVDGMRIGNKLPESVTTDSLREVLQNDTEWECFGYLPILTYPSFIPSRIADQEFFRRIAGRLGVGEICFTMYGLTIFMNGHNIWCQQLGVVYGKNGFWKRKFGSR